ncbi:MAG: hypothetical protein K4445_06780 [Deltaproteobacteria bacterium]|jgi:hypothetical protein|nr:hypothetical protein [Syntrophaceae bacterium]
MMDFLLMVLFMLMVSPIILDPFLVKVSHWIAAQATVERVSPEALDGDVKAFIDQAGAEFAALGFQFAGYMVLHGYTPRLTSYFGLFRHDALATTGTAAVILHDAGCVLRYHEFSTVFPDGRIIDVSNAPLAGACENPEKISYCYPQVRSIGKLYEIHRWVAGPVATKFRGKSVFAGSDTQMVARALDREAALQAKYGYYVLNENRTRYEPTWKGAFMMTRRRIFPFKPIFSYLETRLARKAIADMPA